MYLCDCLSMKLSSGVQFVGFSPSSRRPAFAETALHHQAVHGDTSFHQGNRFFPERLGLLYISHIILHVLRPPFSGMGDIRKLRKLYPNFSKKSG